VNNVINLGTSVTFRELNSPSFAQLIFIKIQKMKRFRRIPFMILFTGFLIGISSCAVHVPAQNREPEIGLRVTTENNYHNHAWNERHDNRKRYKGNAGSGHRNKD